MTREVMGRRPTQGDEKRVLFSNYCCWKRRPPLCHLDRSSVPGFPASRCSRRPRVRLSLKRAECRSINATVLDRKSGGGAQWRDLRFQRALLGNVFRKSYAQSHVPRASKGVRECRKVSAKSCMQRVGKSELRRISSVCPMRKSHQIQPITSCRLHPLWTIEMHHSVRSACTGFTEAARRAGTMLATSAHTASMTIDPPRTTGSQPFTW